MTACNRSQRGFSLVEMLIATLIATVIVAGAVALMVSTQKNFQSTSNDRGQQETARISLGHIADNLRNAGFGVDPALAFDFGPMANVRMDRAYAGQTFATTSVKTAAGAACAPLCRDSATAPDEIVFYARDPAFGPHPLTVAANAFSTSLTVAGVPAQTSLNVQNGQVLLVACYTGNMTWAYVTANGPATSNGNGTFTIPIASSAAATFPTQNAWLADGCFASVATMAGGVPTATSLTTAAEVFKIDRYHYFVQSYDAAGNVQPWGTPTARPYLMLDQGLTDAAGNTLTTVVTADVEDLQFGYVYPYDAIAPLVAETAGAGIANDDTGVNLAPASGPPIYSDAPAAATRQNHHPGNIGAVRVALVVRSPVSDADLSTSTTIPAAGNRPDVVGPQGYRRLRVDTTIAVPNLSMAAPYFPMFGPFPAGSGARQLNVGGG